MVDPLAEGRAEMTPYHYTSNNPINRIDPDGRWDWVADKDNNVRWRDNVTSATDSDLKEGDTYIGKTGTYTAKGGYTVNLYDKKDWGEMGRRWDYQGSGDIMTYKEPGMTIQEAVQMNMPMLNVAEGIATGAAMIASGGIGAVEAGGTYAIGMAARRADFLGKLALTEARALGVAGEAAVGIAGGKTAIEVAGRTRIPDRLANGFLEEVKNVKYQSFTRQLRDFYQYSQDQGLRMILHTRSSTTLSKPLQALVDQGKIIQQFIPGL